MPQNQLSRESHNGIDRDIGCDGRRVKTSGLQVVAHVSHDTGCKINQESAGCKHPQNRCFPGFTQCGVPAVCRNAFVFPMFTGTFFSMSIWEEPHIFRGTSDNKGRNGYQHAQAYSPQDEIGPAPAKHSDGPGQKRTEKGSAQANSHHGYADHESAVLFKPVCDQDGHRYGTGSHCKESLKGAHQIELPELVAETVAGIKAHGTDDADNEGGTHISAP